ncbi:hypothetical protein [Clostridium chrysemydis]|uniref:hypothetical protein n=1 Tax=Clostridium chrysemydis TaxID=2665504 RepID=UPI0018844868|nr:hypothetical protein [Clostridium chrysemydis]
MKLSDYFEIKKPNYRYIKITPHKSIRNYTTQSLAKSIASTYRSLNKKIYRERKKLIIEQDFSIKYVIDIDKENTDFYFVVPNIFLQVCLEKIMEIWNKATVEVVEGAIKPFSKDSEVFGLSYKYLDGMSLNVDRKLNEPLNSILRCMEIMQDNDRVTVVYNFMPRSDLGFKDIYNTTINKFKEKKNIQKPVMNFEFMVFKAFEIISSILNTTCEVINDFVGGKEEIKINRDFYLEGLLERKNEELSILTKKKKDLSIIDTQVAVVSSSVNAVRRSNNIDTVCQAFRSVDGDNELIRNKSKGVFNLEDYSIKTKTSVMSSDEVSQLIQIPGRTTLMQLGIKYVKTEEAKIPKELQEGKKRLGSSKFRGVETKAYLEEEYNVGNLPLAVIGSQGGGKTTYMCNYANDCINAGEGLVIIDFIKNCGLSNDIKSCIDNKSKLIEIDLGSQETIQGLGFNEVEITKDMSSFDRLKYANLQSQQLMDLIDSISVGDPLSSRMRRFLNSAGNIVFALGYNSVKNVVECLDNHIKREKYLAELNLCEELKENLSDEINTLLELNEMSKVSVKDIDKGEIPFVIGTKENKIEHIIDRISSLREDFKLKYMYNKPLKDNINLVKCMEEGKVVLFKMKESDFPTKMSKNLLVTYLISKVWLASQLRGMVNDKPCRCNIIIDEVFQAPTAMNKLEYILPQCRKFGLKFVFSTQYIRQLEKIFDTLEASGSSYMLLKGALEDDFNHFKSKLEGFEYEDLRDMEQYHSLNLIYYSKGYSSFITKLPRPL